jgi:phage recombination protein Bet
MNDLQVFRESELALIRRTVARECEPAEFDQFIHICKAIKLDPLRRQIYAFVFGKGGKPEDRKLTVVTAIDGYRSISARSGDYRPADRTPLIEYDAALKGPSNPLGILRCEVTLYKFAHGGWHPVVGEAYWDEFVPLAASNDDVTWEDTGEVWADSGKPKKKKVVKPGAVMGIDPGKTGWIKSPRNQIAKCAEAQAHRKGWPNDFAGVEVAEEVDRLSSIELTASEIADKSEQDGRMAKLGGPNLFIVDWMDGKPLDMVPAGKFTDRVLAYLKDCEGPATVSVFAERNAVTLRQFWGHKPGEALAIKKEIEKAQAQPVETEAA